jgi:hypothetical protein
MSDVGNDPVNRNRNLETNRNRKHKIAEVGGKKKTKGGIKGGDGGAGGGGGGSMGSSGGRKLKKGKCGKKKME